MADTKPKVYAWCNSGMGSDMQGWLAMHEDGEVITSHLSSCREWGIHDVTNVEWKRDKYEAKFGEGIKQDDIDFIIVDEGEAPPDEVYERNQARRPVDVNDEEPLETRD